MQRFFCRCLYPQKPQAWLRTIHLLIPPDLADQQYRVWVVDSAMCLENRENFTHNHNPYTRAPPYGKVFLHLGRSLSCGPPEL